LKNFVQNKNVISTEPASATRNLLNQSQSITNYE